MDNMEIDEQVQNVANMTKEANMTNDGEGSLANIHSSPKKGNTIANLKQERQVVKVISLNFSG